MEMKRCKDGALHAVGIEMGYVLVGIRRSDRQRVGWLSVETKAWMAFGALLWQIPAVWRRGRMSAIGWATRLCVVA